MTFSQHVATASLLSRLTGLPVVGLVIGFISHTILDSVEPQEHKFNAFKPDTDFLSIETLLTLVMFCLAWGNTIMIWTIAGAIAPDVIDSVLSIFDMTRYQTGQHLFWFHRPGKPQKTMTKKMTIIISIILFLVVFIWQ